MAERFQQSPLLAGDTIDIAFTSGHNDHPEYGGEFEMMDPRGAAPMMHAPMLKFSGDGGLSAGSAETIEPRPGLLFIFPSFLLHAVRPYRGPSLRISIAINFGIDPTQPFEEA